MSPVVIDIAIVLRELTGRLADHHQSEMYSA